MSITEEYTVSPVTNKTTHDWLMNKHYLKRVPPIQKSFGLFKGNELLGVVTYGSPARNYNGAGKIFGKTPVQTYELNRLVVNGDLPKNVLSFFVSQSFRFFTKPSLIISYADETSGHHGYIYQSLNFLYVGKSELGHIFKDKNTGKEIHQRTINSLYGTVANGLKKNKNIEKVEIEGVKHRYFFLIASKKVKKSLMKQFTYEQFPYPKGDNTYYDDNYKPKVAKHNYW